MDRIFSNLNSDEHTMLLWSLSIEIWVICKDTRSDNFVIFFWSLKCFFEIWKLLTSLTVICKENVSAKVMWKIFSYCVYLTSENTNSTTFHLVTNPVITLNFVFSYALHLEFPYFWLFFNDCQLCRPVAISEMCCLCLLALLSWWICAYP